MKNKDLFQLKETLKEFSNVKGREFAYAIFKNTELIDAELQIFEKLRRQPHPDYFNYENERSIVCMTHSVRDENGNPKIMNNRYEIANMAEFNKDMEELRLKYVDVLRDLDEAEKDFNGFMEKDIEVNLIKIKVSQLPDDIDADKLFKLKDILIEE
jgi:hypothetical protein